MGLMNAWDQWFPSGKPPLTEENLPRQEGKVFIVTGGNSGIGFELVRILYSAGATVYMAARSKEKAEQAIESIRKASETESTGHVKFLMLDLNDLSTIKASAAEFAAQEQRLDVLFNNAGVGNVPVGTVTAQGIEQHLGVNCVGPQLFTRLLHPQLLAAASSATKASVRVVWTSSYLCDSTAPQGGIVFDELPHGSKDAVRNYAASKCGNWLLAAESAKRWGNDGIVSVVQNPGNLKSEAWRHTPWATMLFVNPLLHPAVYGAYTELYAGLSLDIGEEQNGCYILPWGRVRENSVRPDIERAMLTESEGGTEVARKFWELCEEIAKPFE